jgi:phage-related protein
MSAIGEVVASTFSTIGGLVAPLAERFGGLGGTMESVSRVITSAMIGLEFVFKNWKDVLAQQMLRVGEAAVTLKDRIAWVMTEVIPQTLQWLWNNWRDIFQTLANFTRTTFQNIATNIASIVQNLPGLIRGSVDWSDVWKPLTDGFRAEISKLPEIAKFQRSEMANALGERADVLGEDLNERLQHHMRERLNEISEARQRIREMFQAGDDEDQQRRDFGFGDFVSIEGGGRDEDDDERDREQRQAPRQVGLDQFYHEIQKAATGRKDADERAALASEETAKAQQEQNRQAKKQTDLMRSMLNTLQEEMGTQPQPGPATFAP